MDTIKIEQLSKNALTLFADARKAFAASSSVKLKERSKFVPKTFVDENKKVRIVFVGQYSAGKSSILSIPSFAAVCTINSIKVVKYRQISAK